MAPQPAQETCLALPPRLFRGVVGRLFTPPIALALLILAAGGGWLASGEVAKPAAMNAPKPASGALASRPNVILVMVDTLRADHLDCYGGTFTPTPNLCRIATDGGTIYSGFSHASWTKPAAASLLTSLVPTSHQAMSKTAALPAEIETLAEALAAHGYTRPGTGCRQGPGSRAEIGAHAVQSPACGDAARRGRQICLPSTPPAG